MAYIDLLCILRLEELILYTVATVNTSSKNFCFTYPFDQITKSLLLASAELETMKFNMSNLSMGVKGLKQFALLHFLLIDLSSIS